MKLKALKKLKKYWLIPSLLLTIEASILTYSIAKNRSFINANKYIVRNAIPSIVYDNKVIPQIDKYHFEKDQVKKESLEKALQNPKTINRARELFVNDFKNKFSEISGIATLVEENDECFINFYEMQTKNEVLARALHKEKGNERGLMRIIKENESYFKYVLNEAGVNKKLYNEGMRIIREGKKGKSLVLSSLVDAFIEKSDCMAGYCAESLIEFCYKTKIKGKYIADFHTHNDGSPPKEHDVKSSRFIRQIVLSLKRDGFDLYDIVKSKSTKISYRK